jgi:4'-phosphopantetheinyl transferase
MAMARQLLKGYPASLAGSAPTRPVDRADQVGDGADQAIMSSMVAPYASDMQRLPMVCWYDAASIKLDAADLAVLSPAERTRASALAFAADRHRYLVAHFMLRRLVGNVTGSPPARLLFGRESCPVCGRPSGRPRLGGRGKPYFSLSHSGDTIAIAIGPDPLGVDCERLRRGCVCDLVTHMHPADASLVTGLPEPRRHARIIDWWVCAEAALKSTGQGIAHGMSGVRVLGAGQEPALADGRWLGRIAAPAGYAAALAVVQAGGQGPVRN